MKHIHKKIELNDKLIIQECFNLIKKNINFWKKKLEVEIIMR